MVLNKVFVLATSFLFISGCVASQERSLRSGNFCAKTEKESVLVFISAIPIALLQEGWDQMLSVIEVPLHPLEIFGGVGKKGDGFKKVGALTAYPREDDLRPGDDADRELFLVGDPKPASSPGKKEILLEARYTVTLRSGKVLPQEFYRRSFMVSFRPLSNCIYRIEEIDKEWTRIK